MLVVAGLFGIVVAMGIAAITAHPPTDAQIAAAQDQYSQQFAKCMNHPDRLPPTYDSLDEYCRTAVGPYMDGILLRDLDTIVQHIATFVILLGTVLAASLGGADWTSNTMTTLLTWEPRRVLVYLTRALVVAAFVAALTAFYQIVFAGVYALVAATRGSTLFLPPHLWSDLAGTIGRVSVMAVALGLVAYAVAMFGRSTVSSLGALFGYLILFEGVIAGFRPSIQGSLLVRGAGVIVSQQPIYGTTRNFSYDSSGVGATPPILMGVSRAWVVVAVYVVVLTVLSVIQYKRRDVT
jgi:ABC-type transport system involved in multi-copper enzyme maturation permease subunit